MLNRLFGNYLVNRGYLNPAQLDDLLETITDFVVMMIIAKNPKKAEML